MKHIPGYELVAVRMDTEWLDTVTVGLYPAVDEILTILFSKSTAANPTDPGDKALIVAIIA